MDQTPEHKTDALIAAMLAMLRLMADGFIAAFGAPAAMLKDRPYGKLRERILRWLHDMEAVARRMLLLRATRFAPRSFEPLVAQALESAAQPAFGKSPTREIADLFRSPTGNPETWRVHLHIDPPRDPVWDYENPVRTRNAPSSSYSNRTRHASIYADCPRPLAERFEAILRVLADPDGYAARLAQRLHRWRCRPPRRQDFVRAMSNPVPIANEAGLDDTAWDPFAAARGLMLEMAPDFSAPETG